MTDRLSPHAVNEWIDAQGLHTEARSPGCYAVQLETPSNDADAVSRRWADHYDAPMPDGVLERLTACERFVYVGSHGRSVYERLVQHARDEQSASIMDVWKPVAVVDVWIVSDPDTHEFNVAVEKSGDGTVSWYDGELI